MSRVSPTNNLSVPISKEELKDNSISDYANGTFIYSAQKEEDSHGKKNYVSVCEVYRHGCGRVGLGDVAVIRKGASSYLKNGKKAFSITVEMSPETLFEKFDVRYRSHDHLQSQTSENLLCALRHIIELINNEIIL